MAFYDRKEEVIDVELTQYGKHLLSIGRFKPDQYAFFDDDILYDIKYSASGSDDAYDSTQRARIFENQNTSEIRIKETPRPKVQYNFSDREKRIGTAQTDYQTDCGPRVVPQEIVEKLFLSTVLADPGETAGEPHVINLKEIAEGANHELVDNLNNAIEWSHMFNAFNVYSAASSISNCLYQKSLSQLKYYPYILPLGNSSMSKKFAPAWSIKFLNGDLLTEDPYDSLTFYSGSNFSTMKIPQLETKVQYDTYITKMKGDGTYANDYATEDVAFAGQIDTPTFKDNTLIQVKSNYLLLELEELHTDFIKDNFEIEVFRVLEEKTATQAYVYMVMIYSLINATRKGVLDEKTLSFKDSDGNAYSAEVDKDTATSTSTVIGISGISNSNDFMTELKKSIDAAGINVTITQNPNQKGNNNLFIEQDSSGKKGNVEIGGTLTQDSAFLVQDKGGDTDTYSPEDSPRKLDFFVGGDRVTNRQFKQLYFYNPEVDNELEEYHVEYYFDLLVDEEIESKFYCKSKNVDKKQNILSDQKIPFNCDDFPEPEFENIYKIVVTDEDFKVDC